MLCTIKEQIKFLSVIENKTRKRLEEHRPPPRTTVNWFYDTPICSRNHFSRSLHWRCSILLNFIAIFCKILRFTPLFGFQTTQQKRSYPIIGRPWIRIPVMPEIVIHVWEFKRAYGRATDPYKCVMPPPAIACAVLKDGMAGFMRKHRTAFGLSGW